MAQSLKRLFLSGDRLFISLRALSTITALVFALVYSKHLGVERRGLLTFIMTTNLVFSILLISGISLHLRNLVRNSDVEPILTTYLVLVLTFSSLTPFLNYLVLRAYESVFNSAIPNNLLFVSMVYCFFSTLSYGMHDALLLIKSIRIASILDFGVVIIQILSYLTLVYSGETSYFVSVLISLSISYLVMVVSSLLLVLYVFTPKINFSLDSLRQLISDSSTPTFINITSQLLERIDKVFLGIQVGVADLGKFSTNQSIIGIVRFIPDALTKLSLARDTNYLRNKFLSARTLFVFAFVILSITEGTSLFTHFVLGAEWELPLTLLFAITLLEFMRGLHSLVVMNAVRANVYAKLKRITLVQSIIGLLVLPIAIHFFGLWGSIFTSLAILIMGVGFLRNYVNE